ncbi:MAG: MarR family winged helix-turn-helix transcriptional regulator [Candidatus Phaeomarinobacter sp.]
MSKAAHHEVDTEDTGAAELSLEGEFAWAVHDVRGLIGRLFDRRMREIGLTQAQGRVLAVLRRTDGATQTEIADQLDMERAPIGKLVDRLEEAGFVERRADACDRRVKRVYLMPKFASVAAEMLSLGEEIFVPAFEGISPAKIERITAVLLHIKTNLIALDAAQSSTSN